MAKFKITICTRWFYHLGSPLEITVKIKNTEKRDYYILFRSTPFDSIHDDSFHITCNHETVEYDSIYAKRTPVTSKNFVLVKAGKTKKATILLAERYYFRNGGFVNLEYKPVIFYTAYLDYYKEFTHREELKDVRKQFFILDSSEIYPTRGIKMRMEEMPEWNKIYSENYSSPDMEYPAPCVVFNQTAHTDEKKKDFKNIVMDSHYELIHYLIHCINELQADSGEENIHYQMIFGRFDNKRYKLVHSNFDKILKAVRSIIIYKRSDDFTKDSMTGISMDDDCYGYINKNGTQIFLCRPFLEAVMTGTNSRVGVLLHELSHVYSKTGDMRLEAALPNERELCIELAKINPEQAVRNADSYEFFLESRFLNWMERTKWSGTDDVDTKILGGPSIVSRNHIIYLFYLNREGILKTAVCDELGYEVPVGMRNAEETLFEAQYQPESIVFHNIIYVFYIPKGKEGLYYTRKIGSKWEKGRAVLYLDKESLEKVEIKPLYTPHPVEYQGGIVLVYCRKHEDVMYMVSGDGNIWNEEKRVSGNPYLIRPVCYNPAVVVFGGTLYIIYTYYESSGIYYAFYNPKIEAWIMDRRIEISRAGDGSKVYAESDMEVRGVLNKSIVYLLFRGRDGKLRQIQMNRAMYKGALVFTDYEAVDGSLEQKDVPHPVSICSFARDDRYSYLAYACEEDGIFINRQMPI